MPTYEYACKDCGQHMDVVQSFHDDPLTVCPSCDGTLRKVFSAAGIIFKGSGWHIKDYASKGAASKGASGSAATGPGADSGASDSKSDTASASDTAATSSPEARSA